MASKPRLTPPVALMLLLITCRESMHCSGLSVDPPENIVIEDLGHLGSLQITWSPPASLNDMTECPKVYQLEYFNTYSGSWSVIRTARRSYTAQFDLMKDVKVRVYTLLSGSCTNFTMIKSTNYAEVVQEPPSTGLKGTAAEDFVCVNYNMQYMDCKWRNGPKMPANAEQKLFFWHKELEQAEECSKYLMENGVRIGCHFSGSLLPDFTDINFCINGSSPEGPLEATFASLQVQNQVKPETAEKLNLQTDSQARLVLQWDRPAGNVPGDCLEWEVEQSQEGPDGKSLSTKKIPTNNMQLNLDLHGNERNCFRVRSRLHKYCVDKSFWSEWSQPACHPDPNGINKSVEKKEVAPEPEWDVVHVYVYIAVAIIAALVLLLCVGAVFKARRSSQVKRPNSLLNTLFTRNSQS